MVGACQQNSGIFLIRGGGLEREIGGGRQRTRSETKLRVYCCEKQDGAGGGAGDQITGQVADSERPGTGRDAGGGRGLGRDKMPAGIEAGTGTRCRRGPRLSRQGANQLKRKRSIISSSNPGFSKSFSLVMIKLLCSKNPASW